MEDPNQTNFDIDQSLKSIDSSMFHLHETLTQNGKWSCTKTGWLSIPAEEARNVTADDDFPILFSPGQGVIIHKDLYDMIPEPLKAPIVVGKTLTAFHMPTKEDMTNRLKVVGETYFPFYLEDIPRLIWTHFNVKALVVTSELPNLSPSYSRKMRPLMWVGVGLNKMVSLFRLEQNPDPKDPQSKHGYTVTRDDGGVSGLL